jgi:hypothetical protein
LVGLIGIADADATPLPGIPPFLEGGIVDLAVDFQDAVDHLALLAIGIEAVLVTQKLLTHRFSFWLWTPTLPAPTRL